MEDKAIYLGKGHNFIYEGDSEMKLYGKIDGLMRGGATCRAISPSTHLTCTAICDDDEKTKTIILIKSQHTAQ